MLTNIPKPVDFSYKIHSSATKKIRFTKEIQTAPFFKNPREVMMIYSIFEDEKMSNKHFYGNLIFDEDGSNQILELL